MSDEKFDALRETLGADIAGAVAGKRKGKTMGKNPDLEVLDLCGDVLDRLKERRGMTFSTQTARAMLQTGLDIEAGRVAPGQRIRTKDATLYDAAVAAAGQPAVDQVLQALIDQAGAPVTTKLTDGQKPAAKAYNPRRDALALGVGADQVKGHQR